MVGRHPRLSTMLVHEDVHQPHKKGRSRGDLPYKAENSGLIGRPFQACVSLFVMSEVTSDNSGRRIRQLPDAGTGLDLLIHSVVRSGRPDNTDILH